MKSGQVKLLSCVVVSVTTKHNSRLTFNQLELQKVCVKDENTFKIEKIHKTRGRGPIKQHFVKWLHWPNKFNS